MRSPKRLDATLQNRLDPALASRCPCWPTTRHTLKSLQQAGTSVTAMANDIRTTTQRLERRRRRHRPASPTAQVMAAAADNFQPLHPAQHQPRRRRNRPRCAPDGLAASAVSDNPQLFIYGSGRLPGPGEPVCPALAHPDRQRHAPCTPSHVLP